MKHRGFNRPRQTKCIGSKFQRHWLCRAGIFREIELCGVGAEQDRDGVINQLHRRVRDEHDARPPTHGQLGTLQISTVTGAPARCPFASWWNVDVNAHVVVVPNRTQKMKLRLRVLVKRGEADCARRH